MAIKRYTTKSAPRSQLAQMVNPDMALASPVQGDLNTAESQLANLGMGQSLSYSGERELTPEQKMSILQMGGYKTLQDEASGQPRVDLSQFDNPEADRLRALRAEIAARPTEPNLSGLANWVNFRGLNPSNPLHYTPPDKADTQAGHDESIAQITQALAEQADKKQTYQANILKDLIAMKGDKYSFAVGQKQPSAMGGVQDRANAKLVEAYSKRLEKLAPMDEALKTLESVTNRDGAGGVFTNPNAKLVSVGKLESALPNVVVGAGDLMGLTDPGAPEERAAINSIKQHLGKLLSGTAMSDNERAEIKQTLGFLASGDEKLVAKGLRSVGRMGKGSHVKVEGGYGPSVKGDYRSQSGEDPMAFYNSMIDDSKVAPKKVLSYDEWVKAGKPAQ